MKPVVQIAAYALLLLGTLFFGAKGQAAEMGLAIVASSIALAFAEIERFSRIRGAGFEAELRDQFQAVLEKETEVPSQARIHGDLVTEPLEPRIVAVMRALADPGYTWRYFGGVRKDSKLDSKDVSYALNWLVTAGYARRSQKNEGPIWSLTAKGRDALTAGE